MAITQSHKCPQPGPHENSMHPQRNPRTYLPRTSQLLEDRSGSEPRPQPSTLPALRTISPPQHQGTPQSEQSVAARRTVRKPQPPQVFRLNT